MHSLERGYKETRARDYIDAQQVMPADKEEISQETESSYCLLARGETLSCGLGEHSYYFEKVEREKEK